MSKNFSKEDTKVMKGIAIILMLMHHLWTFPDRIAGGELEYHFMIFEQSSISYFGMFGQICVSLFFFLGGYGIYKSEKNKIFDPVGKIKNLYLSFWKVFIIFIPIAFIFFSNQSAYCSNAEIWNRYSEFKWIQLWANFFGVSTTYNGEWWFLISYVYAILSFPFLRKICEKYTASINIALIIVSSILVTNVMPAIGDIEIIGSLNSNYLYRSFFCQSAPYVACFWMGIEAAKDNLLIRIKQSLEMHHLSGVVCSILIWVTAIYMRNSLIGNILDIIYVPFLIVASMNLLQYLILVKKIFLKIGEESTNMWLIHSFLCYYFDVTAMLIAAPKWGILSLIILIFLSYIISLGITLIWKLIANIHSKIIKVM